MSETTELYLTSPAFKANPFPAFALLRADDPVHQINLSDGQRVWLITRYQDADIVLRDERFVKERLKHGLLSWEQPHLPGPVGKLMNQILLNIDPPDHTRLRQLLTLSFTPRLVEQWRGRIQEITDELIDAIEGQGVMDLIDQFAFPLPIRVISEMLGVPAKDSAQFRTWSNVIAEAIGDPLALQQAGDQFQAFHTYLLALIEEKRQKPEDSLLSRLIQAETEGDRLSLGELVSMVFLLLIAGHETTVNLIGNGMLALLEHPDQMTLLKQNPALIKTAIEEFLRYRGSLMLSTPRWASADVLLGGKLIRRGDQVLVALVAANRDGETFTEPDTLDITRQENRHLAFGKGIHYCLGAPLARLEGQIALGTLLRRLPHLRLESDREALVWRPGSMILGLRHLPVVF
ncbi:cytochrome P450 [Reticulibacter mediterranei]|uniref:Cytochrome P450 n=1 Tax=Reticulibacter mediterranei TaxID=2778369 RepID=A0A8J3IXF2_9CHLR|nr:cytochrome P450 [Reticulibacter mediterranei]GHO98562.1 cytochrome P450 [Reticulibacter mediterranei]